MSANLHADKWVFWSLCDKPSRHTQNCVYVFLGDIQFVQLLQESLFLCEDHSPLVVYYE